MKINLYYSIIILIFAVSSCKEDAGLTEAEVVDGLKTALNVGTDSTVKNVSATDGYYGDQAIKI